MKISAEWLENRAIIKLLKELDQPYFVGGCVRDTLLNLPTTDLDIATATLPEDILNILKRQNLKGALTGKAHGTITLHIPPYSLEITPFRKDIQTDGRHATVEFCEDWKEDAARRDFTINALYADLEGQVYDLFDGIGDLRKGKVHFIGDPEKRIQEDYLRILRFFRFFSRYGIFPMDEASLFACKKFSGFLPQLSAERITQEIFNILASPRALEVSRILIAEEIFKIVLPSFLKIEAFERILKHFNPDPLQSLMTLGVIDHFYPLCLSTEQKRRMDRVKKFCSEKIFWMEFLYDFGALAALDLFIYQVGHALIPFDPNLLSQIQNWVRPDFPIKAQDLIDHGYQPGPELGKTLKAIERLWVKEGFTFAKHPQLSPPSS